MVIAALSARLMTDAKEESMLEGANVSGKRFRLLLQYFPTSRKDFVVILSCSFSISCRVANGVILQPHRDHAAIMHGCGKRVVQNVNFPVPLTPF